jgi:hypothetical protein
MRVRRVVVTNWAMAILAAGHRDMHAEVLKKLPPGAEIVATVPGRRRETTNILVSHAEFEDIRIGQEPPVHPMEFDG